MGARMRKLISSSKFPYSGKSDRNGYLQGGYDMALGVGGFPMFTGYRCVGSDCLCADYMIEGCGFNDDICSVKGW